MTGRLLTADQLAARWQVPKSWVYAATRDHRIPAVRLGRYYRYRLESVEDFEASGGCALGDEGSDPDLRANGRRSSNPSPLRSGSGLTAVQSREESQ